MAASLEETLISVWEQALAENARTVELEDAVFRFAERADPDCAKWILNLKVISSVVSNKILRLPPAGRN
jgi:hypothetical protein